MRVDLITVGGSYIINREGLYFDGNDIFPNQGVFRVTGASGWSNFGVARMEGGKNGRIFTANENYLFGH